MNEGMYDRWRPAIAAFAVLLTVVAIAVSSRDKVDSNSSAKADVVEISLVPAVTVPLTRTLKSGMKGDDVLRVQQRLAQLRFDPGPQDGVFGQNTMQAVWAFEKLVLGVPSKHATGEVTPSTWSIMEGDVAVMARRKADSKTHVEVYLPEQVLVVFTDQKATLITHISSGSNEAWCEEVTIDPGEEGNDGYEQIKKGYCGQAVTTPGIFYFNRRFSGMRESKLGSLYNPVYFNYGLAIHGAILVPLKPASKGCIRMPMSVARYFPALVAYGDRVYVFDGIKEPEQYGSPQPPWDTPDPNYTTVVTSTTLAASTTVVTSATVPKSSTTITTTGVTTTLP